MKKFKMCLCKCLCGEKLRPANIATPGGNKPRCLNCYTQYDIKVIDVIPTFMIQKIISYWEEGASRCEKGRCDCIIKDLKELIK